MKKFFSKLLCLILSILFVLLSLLGCSSIQPSQETARKSAIKNIIFMIPDGGGFDNFTLAGEVKEKLFKDGLNKIPGARTTLTQDALSEYGYNDVTGLYLDRFLVGAASTESYVAGNKDEFRITDSSAAGTTLATGYKTRYTYAGIDKDGTPVASLTELAQANKMSTGIVTTKSFVDATPLAFFSSHSVHRYEYQDNSLQALTSGVDVMIGEGTEYGDILNIGEESSHTNVSASELGYTVATNKEQMLSAVENGVTKLWASISGWEHYTNTNTNIDMALNVLPYDVEASDTTPTLLEMTKVAIQTLSENINNENGFFLMIEGGALDNVAESCSFRHAMGEALAFDETFAYCVKWAKDNGDNTIVISCADHDSGGFYGIENYKEALIDLIISGENDNGKINTTKGFDTYKQMINGGTEMKYVSGHTSMPVPISLYVPESQYADSLSALCLPETISREEIRYKDKPKYYSLDSVNPKYIISNSEIAHAIAYLARLGTLDNLSLEMFVEVARYDYGVPCKDFMQLGTLEFSNKNSKQNTHGTHIYYDVEFISNNGKLRVKRNEFTCVLDGVEMEIGSLGNKKLKGLFIRNSRLSSEAGYQSGSFYLPKCILEKSEIL